MTEEEIARYRPLVWALATEMVSPALRHDAAQEGLIKVWEVLRDRPTASWGYVRRAVRNRLIDISRRQTFTGHTGRRGKAIDPLRRPHESLEALSANGWEPTA
jgi:DNA-directed RNA polymerase specialized sigma24 family protein